ncbi:FAD-dependent oxidoreductase [Rossellomorea sp. DA94]|uniref:flavin monoamine oxidase family protein n=1 Tax=Rossellomorea sp. DA94 TaxID=3038653 RepID=UPI00244B7EF0|nr:FAD-dependent oxidoreductase [Rossellomorea sp. DA94]WGG44786.1 FAD-dependent oxidoreductase [Rossellomorea sp. DA94]
MKKPVIIVGAGLSGLRAASLLHSKGVECVVLEARGRIGGRVISETIGGTDLARVDLGPTWFWPDYEPLITRLVKELGLQTFLQHTEGALLYEQSENVVPQQHVLPEGAVQRSFRLHGGVKSLIDAVYDTLPPGTVQLNTTVKTIRMDNGGGITVEADELGGKKEWKAEAVILAMPPRLVARHLSFSPSLPEALIQSMLEMPTWMAGQAKAIAIYERPFWRKDGLSGQVTSWAGPLQEIHDASPDKGAGALFGFFGMPAATRRELGEDKIVELVLEQLKRLFGEQAGSPISLLYKDWSDDPHTAVKEDAEPLMNFPEYGPLGHAGVWERKILFAGTETAAESGGHLEGALRSAERAVSRLLENPYK